eukprot:Blabericola_migrator_1__7553@NODE_385_length_9127_cov_126_586424_g308_i0_p3_GENE_NODE_385_length_9127_cov_126_586424_g308_i0NODE_385_length_9127_cov_126_586424_g308_i0_p3_ORF_typecomplete_len602_score45_15_NODE_385_length_9127_cov_126_586424_g308_i052277032
MVYVTSWCRFESLYYYKDTLLKLHAASMNTQVVEGLVCYAVPRRKSSPSLPTSPVAPLPLPTTTTVPEISEDSPSSSHYLSSCRDAFSTATGFLDDGEEDEEGPEPEFSLSELSPIESPGVDSSTSKSIIEPLDTQSIHSDARSIEAHDIDAHSNVSAQENVEDKSTELELLGHLNETKRLMSLRQKQIDTLVNQRLSPPHTGSTTCGTEGCSPSTSIVESAIVTQQTETSSLGSSSLPSEGESSVARDASVSEPPVKESPAIPKLNLSGLKRHKRNVVLSQKVEVSPQGKSRAIDAHILQAQQITLSSPITSGGSSLSPLPGPPPTLLATARQRTLNYNTRPPPRWVIPHQRATSLVLPPKDLSPVPYRSQVNGVRNSHVRILSADASLPVTPLRQFQTTMARDRRGWPADIYRQPPRTTIFLQPTSPAPPVSHQPSHSWYTIPPFRQPLTSPLRRTTFAAPVLMKSPPPPPPPAPVQYHTRSSLGQPSLVQQPQYSTSVIRQPSCRSPITRKSSDPRLHVEVVEKDGNAFVSISHRGRVTVSTQSVPSSRSLTPIRRRPPHIGISPLLCTYHRSKVLAATDINAFYGTRHLCSTHGFFA